MYKMTATPVKPHLVTVSIKTLAYNLEMEVETLYCLWSLEDAPLFRLESSTKPITYITVVNIYKLKVHYSHSQTQNQVIGKRLAHEGLLNLFVVNDILCPCS